MSLSLANAHASLPVAYRLDLPRAWASDAARRKETGVPEGIAFKTKPQIALDQIRAAVAAGLPRGVVLMDAGYGVDGALRTAITELGLRYVAGILSTATVWAPGCQSASNFSRPDHSWNSMLCVRCLAMGFHPWKARHEGQFWLARLSAPRGPLQTRVTVCTGQMGDPSS